LLHIPVATANRGSSSGCGLAFEVFNFGLPLDARLQVEGVRAESSPL